MPYELKGKCVYKKGTDTKVGCSKTEKAAKNYLKALYANVKNEGFDPLSINPDEEEIVSITVEPANAMANFVSTLFASRTQAHIFHLQTPSFAAHKALNEYYDEIVGLTDSIIESYQGRYGILRGYKGEGMWMEDEGSVLKYFEALCMYVEKNRTILPQDTYIQNQIDEVVALIESTKYKLKFLH
jgi:hypothetical protein